MAAHWFFKKIFELYIPPGPVCIGFASSLYVCLCWVPEKNKRLEKIDGWMNTKCSACFFLPAIQLGTFRSPEGEFFVEPLHSYQGEHYEEEHTKPHIVYKKSAPKKQTSGENSACDISGTTRYMMGTHACSSHRECQYKLQHKLTLEFLLY